MLGENHPFPPTLSSSRFSSVREWQPATGRPATAAHPRHHHENRRRHCNRRRRRQRRRQRRHRRLLRRSLSSRKPNAVRFVARSLAGSAGRRLSEPSPQSSGIRRREGGTGGRRIGETGPPPSIVGDEDGEGRRHSGRHGTAEDDGRADRGQGCASSCSAMNPVRPSERGRGLTFCLACSLSLAWPWPCPARAAARPWPSPRPRPSSRLCTYFCS